MPGAPRHSLAEKLQFADRTSTQAVFLSSSLNVQVANNLGLVFVVTNAVPGWVEKTIKRLVWEHPCEVKTGSSCLRVDG